MQRSRTSKFRFALLPLLLAFALIAAACGDDDDDASSDTSDTAASTSETTAMAETSDEMAETSDEMADTSDEMADTSEVAGATIVDVATEAGTFTTLIAAVDAAGLTETLMGDGPFTVLAPSDEAFAALPEGTVESLLEDPEGALTDVLSLHVISGTAATSSDVLALGDGATLETLGGPVTVNIDGETVTFGTGDAALVTADIEASNGVIHVIDGVITEAG